MIVFFGHGHFVPDMLVGREDFTIINNRLFQNQSSVFLLFDSLSGHGRVNQSQAFTAPADDSSVAYGVAE